MASVIKKLKRSSGAILGVAFFIIIGWLLWGKLATLDWKKIQENIAETPWQTTLLVTTLAATSYVIFTVFDWLELKKAASQPSVSSSLMSALICYAVNFNFGSILGGVGLRLKLYTDLDVSKKRIARIVTLSTLSNWIGYCLFGGAIFLLWPNALDTFPGLESIPLKPIGYTGFAIAALFVVLLIRQKTMHLRHFKIELPSPSEGFLRIGLGVVNWIALSLIFVTIFCWHYSAPPYIVIVSGLASAIAGVITHIPGGLGVYEATFITSIGPVIGDSQVIAGILYFRFLYYLLPLALALICSVILKMNVQTRLRGQHG